jgi:hypothetical protein
MWPFKHGPRMDQVVTQVVALQNQVNALTAAVNAQHHTAPFADLVPLLEAIVKGDLERLKITSEGRRLDRSMAPRRARDGTTGRFASGPRVGRPPDCPICAKPDSPFNTAKEILWHAANHPAGGPEGVTLPTFSNSHGRFDG